MSWSRNVRAEEEEEEEEYQKRNYEKNLKRKVEKAKCTYACIANTDKVCDFLHDRPHPLDREDAPR